MYLSSWRVESGCGVFGESGFWDFGCMDGG